MNELGEAEAGKQANDDNNPKNRGQSVVFLQLKENRAGHVQEYAHDQTTDESFHAGDIQGQKCANQSAQWGG